MLNGGEKTISREEIWWIDATLNNVLRIVQGITKHNAAFAPSAYA
jgi:hypothetical protein